MATETSSVQAIRDIEVDEELTFDYAMSDSSEYDEFSCACGREKCREKITGMDWQNKDLQTKYRNYFSSDIEKLIKLSHSE